MTGPARSAVRRGLTRLQAVLLMLWLAELAAAVFWWNDLQGRRRPPVANLDPVDPFAADEVRSLAAQCRTPAQWRQLGEVFMAFGAFREAEACHREAAARAPGDGQHVYEWAFALERLGLLDEANEQYRRAAALAPELAGDCWYFVGRNLQRQEKAEAALAALETAGPLAAARYERARLLVRLERYQEAMPVLEALGREYPRTWPTAYLRYRLERLAGDAAQRDRFADAAVLAGGPLPTPLGGHWQRLQKTKRELGISRIVTQARAADAALPSFEPQLREVCRRFWFTMAADLLAEAHFEKREIGEAKRLLVEAIERGGPSAHLLYRLGLVCEESGDRRGALEAWTRAVKLGAAVELQDVHRRLAASHDQDGDHDLAKRHVAQAHFGAGMETFWRGEHAAAKQTLSLAVQSDPTHASAWFYLAETRRLLGESSQARAAYERCLELRPEHGWARRGLKLTPSD